MTNRYLISFLHWITSVITGSLLLFVLTEFSTDVLLLSLIFGGAGSFILFLLSLFFIPRILRNVSAKNPRIAAVTMYSAVCCLMGFILLIAFDVVSWNDLFGRQYSEGSFLGADIDRGIGWSFYAFMIASMLSSVLWTAVYQPKEEVPLNLGVLDQV